MQLLFPLLMVGAAWFLLVRPQQQRLRAQRALLASLDVGDEVITVGGLLGHITAIDGDRLTLSVAPGVDLTFVRQAISQRLGPPTDGAFLDDTHPDDDAADDDAAGGGS